MKRNKNLVPGEAPFSHIPQIIEISIVLKDSMSASQFPYQPHGAAPAFSLTAHPMASETDRRELIEIFKRKRIPQ